MEIAIPFAQVEAINPNIKRKDSDNALKVYLKCIVVCFASCRRLDSKLSLVLYTNKPIETYFHQILNKLKVDIRIVPFTFDPPDIFGDRFRGCFFLFDALKHIQTSTLFLDPDIVAINDMAQIERYCGGNLGIFKLDSSQNTMINGIDLKTANRINREYRKLQKEKEPLEKTSHLGGEILFVPSMRINSLNSNISQIWKWNITRAINGKEFLTTEEHILNQLIETRESTSLNSFISRIWTTRKFTKQQGNDVDLDSLSFWHLPAEKSRGFMTMYANLERCKFQFEASDKAFKNETRKIMNIDNRLNRTLSFLYSLKTLGQKMFVRKLGPKSPD
jgi:hypothetical protein